MLHMKKISILFSLLIAGISLQAQVGLYSFRAFSSSFDTLVNATADNNLEADDQVGAVVPIGFSFTYDGSSYSHVKASSNGWLSFDTTTIASTLSNDLDNSATGIRPLLAPLWDDLSGDDSFCEAGYLTSGSSPNRVFTYEWKEWLWDYTSFNAVISFQVKLYEGSNKIEFRYKQEASAPSGPDASIGIAGSSTGTNNFLSLNGTGTNPSASSSIESNLLSSRPATGQVYEFSPPKNRDAGIANIVGSVCPGSADVVAVLQNYGLDTLTSASIAWSVATNGGTPANQTGASWTGSLLTADTVHVNLGAFNFQAGNSYDIVIYSFSPNSGTDEKNDNDTLSMINYQTGLNGTYTVGGASPDYTSFTAAINDLESRGVCGAVNFNVRYAAYNEQISIGAISGVSASNEVTFQSDPNNVAQPELYFTPAANLYVLEFDGAAWVTFDDIFIESLNSGSGRVVSFTGANSNITLKNCRIKSPGSSTTSANSAVIYDFSGVDNQSEHITIEDNTIEGGSYGIYFYGASTTNLQDDLVIRNNTIDDFYYMGIYTYNSSNVEISDNTLEDNTSYTSPYGIRINYTDSSSVYNNDITLNGTSTPYGIYIFNCDGSAADPVLVYNNFVSIANPNITGSPTGLYAYRGMNNKIYYNTVVLQSGGTASEALYLDYLTTNSVEVLNNSLVNYGNGYATYVSNNVGVDSMDYNNLYSSGTNIAYWSGARTSLAALRAISGKETNGVNVDPNYPSASQLRSYAVGLNDKATPVSAVTTDFEGQSRSSTTPDIGADEYTPPAKDIAVTSILTDDISSCGQTTQTLSVIIQNSGTQSQMNIPVRLEISGAISRTLNVNYAPNLASGASDTVVFSSFNTSPGGNISFKAFSRLLGDTVGFNDTLEAGPISINVLPGQPNTTNATLCAGDDGILVAQGTATIYEWYDEAAGGTLVTTNDTLSLTNVSQTDTFYVESYDMSTADVGALDSTIGGGGNYTSMGQGLVFDVNNTITLDSVTVYPNSNGSVVVNLLNSSGTSLQTRTVTVGSAGAKRIYVGFTISPGSDYELTGTNTTTGGMFRNSSGAVYPYSDIGNNVSITETNNSLGGQGYFYFFYDWAITVEGCHSERKAVIATVNPTPVVSLGADTGFCQGQNFSITLDATNSNSTYIWQDNSTSPTFNANAFGTYWVEVSNSFICVASDTITISSFAKPQANSSVFPDFCESLAPFKLTQGGGSPAGGTGYYYGPGALGDSLFSPAAAGAGTISLSYVYEAGIGCSDTATSSVDILPKPTASLSSLSSVCANASPVTLNQGSGTPAGGTGVYLGAGVSGTSFDPANAGAGTFDISYVYSALNSCVDTAVQQMTVDTLPVVSPGLIPSVCENEIPVTLNQGTPTGGVYTGTGITNNVLDPSITGPGLVPVTYTFTDANNCSGSGQSSVRVHPKANIDIGSDTTICEGVSLNLNAGLGFTTYRWNDGSQQRDKTVNTAGTYTITVTNSNGCEGVDSVTVSIETCTGISEELAAKLRVYPNPTSDVLNLEIPSELKLEQIRISDASGRIVFEESMQTQQFQVKLGEFVPGTYLLELSGDGFIVHQRIVKR